MAFSIGNITSKFNAWDSGLERFFSAPAQNIVSKGGANIAKNSIQTGKNLLQTSGFKVNALTYKYANSIGKKMLDAASKTNPGIVGKVISKVPFLGKLAKGLTTLGKEGGSKIPGLATLFTVGTAAFGIVKAAGKALKGDFAGAGHQLLKTGGSVLGLVAGTALMMTGVGLLPGLALAVGAGFAGDWIGKKTADTLFPSVAQREAEEAQMTNTSAYQGYNQTYSYFGGNSIIDDEKKYKEYLRTIAMI